MPIKRCCATRVFLPGACTLWFIGAGAPAIAAPAGTAPPQGATHKRHVSQPDAPIIVRGIATSAVTVKSNATDMGPLGRVDNLNTPYSVTTLTRDTIRNQQARNLSDLWQDLPSVQNEARGGMNVGRPQSRGFEGSVVANSRIDGLNAVVTTAYPAEQFDSVSVLNGLAGALYGPQDPAGIFDFSLKRPVADLKRATLSFDGGGTVTEAIDTADILAHGAVGYRINALHGAGESYVAGSKVARDLIAGDFNFNLSSDTRLQLDGSYYRYKELGTSAGFSYGATTALPKAPDLSDGPYEQPYTGFTARTSTVLGKLTHDFNADWSLRIGGLWQVADRDLYQSSDALSASDPGTYTQTTSARFSRFKVGSDLAYLNGHFATGAVTHDIVIGTNGYTFGAYGRTGSRDRQTLGTGALGAPQYIAGRRSMNGGAIYHSSQTMQQAVVIGDTVHLTRQWSIMATGAWSWLRTTNYDSSGATSARYSSNGAFSPTFSAMFKPAANQTVYATYANSLQAGDSAPAGTANEYQALAPYRSREYEIGYKLDLGGIALQAAAFRMTRPYAFTDASTNVYAVGGLQRNWGIEVFASGKLTRQLAVLGGATWLDPRLVSTADADTADKLVVGVPRIQANAMLDYTLPLPGDSLLHGMAVTANIHATGRRAANVTNSVHAAGYVTVDLGARYPFHLGGTGLVARVSVSNLANARYWASIFPSSTSGAIDTTNSAFAGLPRTVHASLEVSL